MPRRLLSTETVFVTVLLSGIFAALGVLTGADALIGVFALTSAVTVFVAACERLVADG